MIDDEDDEDDDAIVLQADAFGVVPTPPTYLTCIVITTNWSRRWQLR